MINSGMYWDRPWMKACRVQVKHIGGELRCLGKTKDGEPRHPLMLPRTARLEAYP